MAVRFEFKTGEGIPPSLRLGEPAFDKENNQLYIGDKDKNPIKVGFNYFIINMSYKSDTSALLDKSFDEIKEAIENNKFPIIKFKTYEYVGSLDSEEYGYLSLKTLSDLYLVFGDIHGKMSFGVTISAHGCAVHSFKFAETDLSNISAEDFKAKAEAAGIGGGSGDFVVTTTWDVENETVDALGNTVVTLDKNYTEIVEAYEAGMNVKLIVTKTADGMLIARYVALLTTDFQLDAKLCFSAYSERQILHLRLDRSSTNGNTAQLYEYVVVTQDSLEADVNLASEDKAPSTKAVADYVKEKINEVGEVDNVFVVHATLTSETTATTEESYDEIKEAMIAEKQIVISLGELLFTVIKCVYSSLDSFITVGYEDKYSFYDATITSDGTVTFRTTEKVLSVNGKTGVVSLTASDVDSYTKDEINTLIATGNNSVSSIILNSSTEGSNKQFKITIDDNGTLTATAIDTEVIE